MLKVTRLLLIAFAASAISAATPALAQEAPENSEEKSAESSSDVITDERVDESKEEKIEAPVEKKIPSKVRFFRNLNAKANATVSDGYRLAHILYHQRMNNKKASKAKGDLKFYRDSLISLGFIDDEWSQRESTLLTHVGLSYLLIKAAGIEGGVMWTLTGHSRYAHREMVDRKLFPKVNPRQYITGGQALGAYRACRGYVVEAERRLNPPEPAEEETKPEENSEEKPSAEGDTPEETEGDSNENEATSEGEEPKEDSTPEKEEE